MKFKTMFRMLVVVIVASLSSVAFCSEEMNDFRGTLTPERVSGKIGDEVDIVLQFSVRCEMSRARIKLIIPEGLELVSGNQSEDLEKLKPGETWTRTFRLKIQDIKPKTVLAVTARTDLKDSIMSNCYGAQVNAPPPQEMGTVRTDQNGVRYRVIGISSSPPPASSTDSSPDGK